MNFHCAGNERFNCYSHLVGAVGALLGMMALEAVAWQQTNLWKIISVSVYGTSLFLLFLSSSLYHCSQGLAKERFRRFDHHMIYLLIAGTYTPFALVTLNGEVGWLLLGEVWLLAGVGMAQEALPQPGGRRIVPVIIYLVMGWLIVGSLDPLLAVLPEKGFYWLLAGGICYTSGVFFFALGRYSPWSHCIWHVMVLCGGACHYWVIAAYVL